MSCEPDIRVWVDVRHVPVYLLRGVVVAVLILQCLRDASRVAFVGRSLAIADLVPRILSSLAAATTEKKVIIDLVVRSRLRAIENCRTRAFDPNNNRLVLRVGKDMASQPIIVPSEVLSKVEATANILPLCITIIRHIRIRGNPRHRQHRLFIRHIGPPYLIHRPRTGSQRQRSPLFTSSIQKCIYALLPPVSKTLNTLPPRLKPQRRHHFPCDIAL
jgi:hypothetical protein